jgi:hypothetical protein
MRLFWKIPVLLALCAAVAHAQAVVTLRGAISSMDSTRANIVIQTNGKSQLIVLPSNVSIHWKNGEGPALTVNNLREGMEVSIDAMKSPTGQLTAQTLLIIPSAGGVVPPSTPPQATDVVVDSSGTTVVTPGSGAASRVVAVRSVKLGAVTGEVRVNGSTVFRFRGVHGGDPYSRAQTVAGRLNSAAMAGLQPGEVGVARMNGEYVVTARGTGLITADSTTAGVNRTTPVALAAQWANNLRRQIAVTR